MWVSRGCWSSGPALTTHRACTHPDHLRGDSLSLSPIWGQPVPEPHLGSPPFGEGTAHTLLGPVYLMGGAGVQTEGSPAGWTVAGSGSTGAPASAPPLLPSGHWTKRKACLAWPLLSLLLASPHTALLLLMSPQGTSTQPPNGPPTASGSPQDCLPTDACPKPSTHRPCFFRPWSRGHWSPLSGGCVLGSTPPGSPAACPTVFLSICLQGISRSASSVSTVPPGPSPGAAGAAALRGPSESWQVSWEVLGGRGAPVPPGPVTPWGGAAGRLRADEGSVYVCPAAPRLGFAPCSLETRRTTRCAVRCCRRLLSRAAR